MPEQIILQNPDAPESVFMRELLNMHPLKHNNLYVTAVLTVNGVEVPMVEVLREYHARVAMQLDERAKVLATHILSEAGLLGAVNALRSANFQIKQAVSDALVTIRAKEKT